MLRRAGCLAVGILIAGLLFAGPSGPAQKDKSKNKKKQDSSYALLFGTVFDENGRLVRGAEVRVRQKEGKKHWEATSDVQGEFAVHLPAAPGVYIVDVGAPGFAPDSKEVSFSGDERQDVVFHLARKQS